MGRSRVAVVVLVALLACLAGPAFSGEVLRALPRPNVLRAAVASGPGLYEILPPRFSQDDAAKLLLGMRVIPGVQRTATTAALPPADAVLFGRSAEQPSAIYRKSEGSLVWFPDLTMRGQVPGKDEAARIAREWTRGNRLSDPQEGGEWQVEDVTTLTRRDSAPDARAEDVLQTVRFVRMLDGLQVYGEHSILSVQVGPEGKVAGATRDFRAVRRSARAVRMKSRERMDKEMQDKYNALVERLSETGAEYKPAEFKAEFLGSKLIYYEQGGRYLQPALFGSVLIRGPEGVIGGRSLLVSALEETPEPIQDRTRPTQQPPREAKPEAAADAGDSGSGFGIELTGIRLRPSVLRPLSVIPPDIRYGMYVVRDDSDDWVDDAWDFHTHLSAGNSLYRAFFNPTAKRTVRDQYFWNHVWLFRDGEGQPDWSQYYVRKVDFAIVEGHGAPYLITTERNCCDVIYLDGIPGYGPHSDLGGRTDYILWKSCHVIPAPPEDANWPDVWWKLFKGMRGNYGFCQTMWIDDDISDNFGWAIGLGIPNLSAWFSAVNSCKWNHNNGWEYGSAVMPCGQEGQRIYDFMALPNPGCLTIWWQH